MPSAGILAAADFHYDWSQPLDNPGVFDRLDRRSLLSWSFDVLWEAECRPVVVAAPKVLLADVEAELGGRGTIVEATDRHSTMLGVLANIDCERVVVLDYRHPLAQTEDVRATSAALDEADACVGAVPVRETLKLVEKDSIARTIDRTNMWQQVMPHAFRVGALLDAHRRAADADEPEDEDFDAAQRIKRVGGRVVIAPVSMRNVRIANRDDLTLAHALLGIEA